MEDAEVDGFFDSRAPAYRFNASWWLILYSFSMLARYRPRKWSEALERRQVQNAAALEYGAGSGAVVAREADGILKPRGHIQGT